METSINSENLNKIIINEEPKININIINVDEPKSNSKLLNLPDYFIETYIFPYLSW